MKLNLGCGDNKLVGWSNHDADVDIRKRLPWADSVADFIFCEHCVEHVEYYQAIDFFKECHRVLKHGGVLRISTPSIEQIMKCNDQEYMNFTTKFHQEGATVRGAMYNILYCHGHKTAWTDSLLEATMFYAGFENLQKYSPHVSAHQELRNVEGHHRIITEKWNRLESIVWEGTASKIEVLNNTPRKRDMPVALIIGGSENAVAEFYQALDLCLETNREYEIFLTNDMIEHFGAPAKYGVTLHINKLKNWLEKRKTSGFPDLEQVWAHLPKPSEGITNTTDEWGGSVGLFSVKIAIENDYTQIILCGVPMDSSANHFIRHQRWNAAMAFLRRWDAHKIKIAPYLRSMSGTTQKMFGAPTREWLLGGKLTKAA